MFEINGNNITLTRGNSFKCQVGITIDDTAYTPAQDDAIEFAMKNVYQDEDWILRKTIPHTLELTLDPEDTEELPLRTYFYIVQLTPANGERATLFDGNLTLIPDSAVPEDDA